MTSGRATTRSAEDLMSAAVEETSLVEEGAPLLEETIETEEAIRVENPMESVEETVAMAAVEADEPEEPAKSTSEQLIYIGDPIRKMGVALRTDQVFIGGLPAYLNELYEKYPMIKALFVPVSSMLEAKKEIQTVGTLVYMANRSLKGD